MEAQRLAHEKWNQNDYVSIDKVQEEFLDYDWVQLACENVEEKNPKE